MGTKIAPNPKMKEKTLPKQLLSLRAKTSWSWERMCREFHRVMGAEGPSHTTLFRYATGKVKRPNALPERYMREALHKITVELVQNKLSDSETGRKSVGKELQQAEIRFRSLVENARDLIYRYRLTPTQGFDYINPAIKDLLGYVPEDFYADHELLLKLVHPDDRQRLEQSLQGKGPHHERATLRWVHRDGRLLRIERVNVHIYDGAGKLVAIEGIARDITERKEQEPMLPKSG